MYMRHEITYANGMGGRIPLGTFPINTFPNVNDCDSNDILIDNE